MNKNGKILTVCILVAVMIITGVLLLINHFNNSGNKTDPLDTSSGNNAKINRVHKIDFNAQYVRTDMLGYEGFVPAVSLIGSVAELEEYYETHRDVYYLEHREDSGDDYNVGFLDACDRYDEEFFKEHAIIFAVFEEGSGSVHHKVDCVKVDTDGGLHINIDRSVPEVGNDDMAYWHVITEVSKSHIPANADNVEVYLKGKGIKDGALFKSLNNFKGPYFSITWGTYGISSYDSKTGTLIKTKDATYPEVYSANRMLTDEQYDKIWNLIESLDIESYPDDYDPHYGELRSTPTLTLILTVESDTVNKTVTAENIALTYKSDFKKGQKFLDVFKEIESILTSTEEWQALPDYEFFYD